MTAAGIATALGNAREEGAYWRCRCPVHGGVSLTLGNGPEGRLFIKCWYGCPRNAVVAALIERGLITRDMAKVVPELAPIASAAPATYGRKAVRQLEASPKPTCGRGC
jgi:hypothetical protein